MCVAAILTTAGYQRACVACSHENGTLNAVFRVMQPEVVVGSLVPTSSDSELH